MGPLLNWWFAGILVIFYWITNNLFSWEGEMLEWRTYIFAFVFALIYFLLNMRVRFSFDRITKAIISVPFYIVILLDFSPSSAHLIFLLGSVILLFGKLYLGEHKHNQWENIGYLMYYFLFFHIASKLVYWSDFNSFIWMKVPELSKFYKYSNIIELIVPLAALTIFFSSLILLIFSLKKDFSWEPLKRYWWIIPSILFFTESFSTSEFYLKKGGGAMYHWQPYVGVIEMMGQGGFLLWDTPSTYGFLSLITPYLIPFGDAWQKIYVLNGALRLLFGFVVFSVLWNKKGFIWYLISIGLTLALVYYLPGGHQVANSATTLSGGAMRFIWVVLLIYIITIIRDKDIKAQVVVITPIWLVGFLWSFESALFVTAVLGPYVLYHLFINPEKFFDHLKYFSIIPLSLVVVVFLMSFFYFFRLGHLPDYFAFIEEVFNNVSGYYSELFTMNSPLWIHTIILSWLLSQIHKNKNIHILFSIWIGMWAVLSFNIGQSVEVNLLKILVIYIFGLFLSFKILDDNNEKKLIYHFIPLFVMILTTTFGNPKSARHLYNTFTNQDYTLKNASYKEINDLHEILTIIDPGQTPVTYIDETRYCNYLSKRQYQDVNTKKTISLTNQIWLPLHPPSLIEGYSLERKI